jgi:exodeoxyribonuclease-3
MKERGKMTIINWNISNPSPLRAAKQATWLLNAASDIMTLTETKSSKGCLYLKDRLESFGYHVIFHEPEENGYGVLVASKGKLAFTSFPKRVDYASRVVSTRMPFLGKELEIIAIYVPNTRDEKKKRFMLSLLNDLKSAPQLPFRILCGDLNIIEPDHFPRYSKFEDWEYNFYDSMANHQLRDAFRHLNPTAHEYSWVGRTGDGYRYDHCFVSDDLLPLINKCGYLHETRNLKLSDHSAMYVTISLSADY